MYTTSGALSLGTNLAFNDLPANIKIDFTLANARPWGLGDIMAKFNTGNLRTVNTQVDSASLSPAQSLLSGNYQNSGNGGPGVVNGTSGSSGVAGVQSPSGGPASPTNQNSTAPSTTTKENQSSVSVNSDPNSATGPVKGESVTTSPTAQSSGTSGNVQSQQNQQSSLDIDPVANANSSSEKGYKYSLVKTGNLRSVIVYNKENAKVFESTKTSTIDGQSTSGVWEPKDEAKLVEMVKDTVGDK